MTEWIVINFNRGDSDNKGTVAVSSIAINKNKLKKGDFGDLKKSIQYLVKNIIFAVKNYDLSEIKSIDIYEHENH